MDSGSDDLFALDYLDEDIDNENEPEKMNLNTLDNQTKDAEAETDEAKEDEEEDIDEQSLEENITDHPVYRGSIVAKRYLSSTSSSQVFGLPFLIEVQKDNETTSINDCYYICTLCSRKLDHTQLAAHLKSMPHIMNAMKILLPDQYKDFAEKKTSEDDMEKILVIIKDWVFKHGRGRWAVTTIAQQKSAIETVRKLTLSDCLLICRKSRKVKKLTYKNSENYNGLLLIPQAQYRDINFTTFLNQSLKTMRANFKSRWNIGTYFRGNACNGKYRANVHMGKDNMFNRGPLRFGLKGGSKTDCHMALQMVNSALVNHIKNKTKSDPVQNCFIAKLIKPATQGNSSQDRQKNRQDNSSRAEQKNRFNNPSQDRRRDGLYYPSLFNQGSLSQDRPSNMLAYYSSQGRQSDRPDTSLQSGQRDRLDEMLSFEHRRDIHEREVASDLESHPDYFTELKVYTTNCKKEAALRGIEVDSVNIFKEFRDYFIEKVKLKNISKDYFNPLQYASHKVDQNAQFQNQNMYLQSCRPIVANSLHPLLPNMSNNPSMQQSNLMLPNMSNNPPMQQSNLLPNMSNNPPMQQSNLLPNMSNNPPMQQSSMMLPNMNIPPPMQYNTMSALPSTSTSTGHMNIPTRNSINEVERTYGAAHPVLGNNPLSSQDNLLTKIDQISNRLFSTSRNTDDSNKQQSYLSPHELTNRSMGGGSFDISEAQQFSSERRRTLDDINSTEDYGRLFNSGRMESQGNGTHNRDNDRLSMMGEKRQFSPDIGRNIQGNKNLPSKGRKRGQDNRNQWRNNDGSFDNRRKNQGNRNSHGDSGQLFKRGKREDYPQRNTEGNWKRNKTDDDNMSSDAFNNYNNTNNSPFHLASSRNQTDKDNSQISTSALKGMSALDFHQLMGD